MWDRDMMRCPAGGPIPSSEEWHSPGKRIVSLIKAAVKAAASSPLSSSSFISSGCRRTEAEIQLSPPGFKIG